MLASQILQKLITRSACAKPVGGRILLKMRIVTTVAQSWDKVSNRLVERLFRWSQAFRSYPFCHCRPDRAFSYRGRYFGLCARCTTMYLSGAIAILSFPLWRSVITPLLGLFIAVALIAPGGIDGLTQMFGSRESSNLLRGITGVGLGAGIVMGVYGLTAMLI